MLVVGVCRARGPATPNANAAWHNHLTNIQLFIILIVKLFCTGSTDKADALSYLTCSIYCKIDESSKQINNSVSVDIKESHISLERLRNNKRANKLRNGSEIFTDIRTGCDFV